ncbi:MAG: hypothetical protein IPG21_08500 [Saprospiraceae bacterium]|nr:hypothetical protein [Candidatus Vicinibacter affinis]
MRPFIIGIAVIYCLFWNTLNAQEDAIFEPEPSWSKEEEVNLWSEEIPESLTFVDLVKNPIQVSGCTIENLASISWLTSQEKKSLIEYFHHHSPLSSLLEIQSIPGIGIEKVRLLIKVFSLESRPKLNSFWNSHFLDGKSQLTLRWGKSVSTTEDETSNNSSDKSYLGSQDKLFFRLRHSRSGYFSYGLLAEKDAGEVLWSKSKKSGVDYLSGHIFLERITPRLEKIALGDYRYRIGQGLILDNAFQPTGTSEYGSMVKPAEYLGPYNSVQENQMLRGIALQLRLSRYVSSSLFFSKTKVDANLSNPDSLEKSGYTNSYTSILSSGLHRNKAELSDHNALDILQSGVSMNFRHSMGNIGFAGVYSRLGKDKLRNGSPYQLYQQRSAEQLHFTGYYQHQIRNILLFGETATDLKLGFATLNGLLIGLAKKADAVFIFRKFSPTFNAFQSQTISVTGKSQNETGLFTGINLMVNKELQCNIHFENWNVPWLKYTSDLPSDGKEWAARLQYVKRKKWFSYAQFSMRERQENQIQGKENTLVTVKIQNFRIHLEQKISSDWTWRSRLEWHTFCKNNSEDQGVMIYVDLLYKSLGQAFSGNIRWCIFDTDSYNSRIYAYENDVLYAYSVPSNSGKGSMCYLNLKYKSEKNFSIEVRLSYRMQHQNSPLSGSLKSDLAPVQKGIRMQLNYSF